MLFATLLAAPMPTRRATRIKTEAIVEAEEVSSAETTAIKLMVARMMITAMAITYPRIGRTASRG